MASLPDFFCGDAPTAPGGWGPAPGFEPAHLAGMPFAPFNKSDRLLKCADFLKERYDARRGWNRPQRDQNRARDPTEENEDMQYTHDKEQDKTFALVDNSKEKKNPNYRNKNRRRFNNSRRDQAATHTAGAVKRTAQREYGRKRNWAGNNNKKGNWGNRRRWNDRKDNERDSSVKVQASWNLLQQIETPTLAQETVVLPKGVAFPPGEDLEWAGHLDEYDSKFDRTVARKPATLTRAEDKEFFTVTTMDDPVIERLAGEKKGNVFATDTIVAHLMACMRSVYPWDIVVQRVGNVMFLDHREESEINMLTVNETAVEPPSAEDLDSINHPNRLAIEATMINQNYTQQVLKKGEDALAARKEFEEHPFVDEDTEGEPASGAFRYRRFQLGEHTLVTRTEVHAFQNKGGKETMVNLYALNEWDSLAGKGINWRTKLDSQRGAVLATELKNNSHKVGKWAAQSILAGVDQMKIGFVSRTTRDDQYRHQILGTQSFKPALLAAQINLDLKNAFGILKMIIDMCMAQPSGKYLIMKDPNKAMIRLYGVPDDFGDDEEESSEEESSEEEGGESKE